MALSILKAWKGNWRKGVTEFLNRFLYELKISMFLTGSKNIKELKGKIRE